MAKKSKRSRAEEFRYQQRKNWAKFIVKMSVFVLPVCLLTGWVIWLLLHWGESVPLVYLGFDEAKSVGSLDVKNARLHNLESKPLELEKFGGLDNQTLFVFSKILGSTCADQANPDGELVPIVFVPHNDEEFSVHQFQGLLRNETPEQRLQWLEFSDFVDRVFEGVLGGKSLANRNGRVVLVLDVHHPDVPGGLPPQANSFVAQCEKRWNDLAGKIKKKYPQFDLAIWLSHHAGQNNYLDPDPQATGTFFQRRFESGLLGDQSNAGDELTYQKLKKYVNDWVVTDSLHYKLAQQPVFLDSEGLDFPLYRPRSGEKPAAGVLFSYASRQASKVSPERRWADFATKKLKENWELENPMACQRGIQLLLQLEQLWYAGKTNSNLYTELENQLDKILENNSLVRPVVHSLYEQQREQRLVTGSIPRLKKFELKWLNQNNNEAANRPDAQPANGASQATDLQAPESEADRQLRAWSVSENSWRGSLAIWQAIAQADVGSVQLSTLEQAFKLLPQKAIDAKDSSANGASTSAQAPSGQTSTAADQREMYWSEVAYLERLVGNSEFLWPQLQTGSSSKAVADVTELMHLSIKTRDKANQFAANLSPILVDKFKESFERLENRRRMLEDRLFAYEHADLNTEFKRLADRYENLAEQHRRLVEAVESLHRNLLTAPHRFRYCLESRVVQIQAGDKSQSPSALTDFVAAWNNLGRFDVGNQLDEESARLIEANEKYKQCCDALVRGETLATSPETDEERLKNTKLNVADGNLFARRLLFWPELEATQRQQIRQSLAEKTVEPSGKIIAEKLNDDSAEIPKSVQGSHLRAALFDGAAPFSMSETVGKLGLLTKSAYQAHTTLIQQGDAASLAVAQVLGESHAERSDLDFGRLAADNWGTSAAGSGVPYGLVGLTNHSFLIQQRANGSATADLWDEKLKKWAEQVEFTKDFAEEFKSSSRWNSDAIERRRLINRGEHVIRFAREQFDAGDESVIRILARSNRIDSGSFVPEDGGWKFEDISGTNFEVYLRGHRASCSVEKAYVATELEPLTIELVGEPIRSSEININRPMERKVAGHITFVIDCSGSMKKDGKMIRLKENLTGFLKDLSGRADIRVSMFAIGASLNYRSRTGVESNNLTKIDKWIQLSKSHNKDVIKFSRNREVISRENVDEFLGAVDQLVPFGQTPILEGLRKALEERGEDANLVVLLTDGFELTITEEDKFGEAFNREQFFQLKDRVRPEQGLEMVEFDLFSGNVADEFAEYLPDKNGLGGLKAGRGGIAEINERLALIRSLSSFTKKADNNPNSLRTFLTKLLPVAEVVFSANNREKSRTVESKGVDRNGDGKISDKEFQTMAIFPVLVRELPQDRWSMVIRYAQGTQNEVPRIFAKQTSRWESAIGLAGNENLKFEYDPFSVVPTLTLITDFDVTKGAPVSLSEKNVLVTKTGNSQRQSNFQLAASAKDQLTPAPAFAFLTMQSANEKQRLLIQDFNLGMQTSSNVHPLKFPEIKDALRRLIFSDGRLPSQTLFLTDQVPAGFWTKLHLNQKSSGSQDSDRWKILNEGMIPLQLKPDWVSVNKLLPKNQAFAKFELEMRRREVDDDHVEYSVRVSGVEGQQVELDRWFVQLINADGSTNHLLNRTTRRNYRFRDERTGKRLIDIEHQFTIRRDSLSDYPATLGIGHYDQLPFEKLQSVEAN